MSGDLVLIAFRPLAYVFAIDRANITPTNCGRLRLDEHLAMAWFRIGKVSKFYRAVPREHCSNHCITHMFISLCFVNAAT
jgi:hypothetical protein